MNVIGNRSDFIPDDERENIFINIRNGLIHFKLTTTMYHEKNANTAQVCVKYQSINEK